MMSQIERYEPGGVAKESFVCSLVDSLRKAQSVTNEVVNCFNCSELVKTRSEKEETMSIPKA